MFETSIAQHTQGPWEIGVPTEVTHDYPERYISGSVNVRASDGAAICTVYGGHKFPEYRAFVPTEQRAQNACLIAAAPELLAAAKVILLTPHIAAYLSEQDPKALEQLQRAIATAEGRA